jgi:hypothetical protein
MASDMDSVRRHLLALAERRRIKDWPNDWRPYEVTNSADSQPFNDETAWELIIHLLRTGCLLSEKMQRNPPVMAYEIVHCLPDGWQVFIKIRPGKGCILGRSFHYDEGQ